MRKLIGVDMETQPMDLMFWNQPTSWLLVLVLVILLFGKGKVSDLMGDFAKGIKAFKKGMAEEEQAPAQTQPKPLDQAKSEAGAHVNTGTGTKA
jgi:sec-independent protein translocase protein TatA